MTTRKPANQAHLDLDSLDREARDVTPFTVNVRGKQFTLRHPEDMDWQDAFAASTNENPLDGIAAFLGDQYEEFSKLKPMPVWKLNAMIKGAQEHYGIELPDAEGKDA